MLIYIYISIRYANTSVSVAPSAAKRRDYKSGDDLNGAAAKDAPKGFAFVEFRGDKTRCLNIIFRHLQMANIVFRNLQVTNIVLNPHIVLYPETYGTL